MQAILGIIFHFIGGFASGSFYMPYKKVKGWTMVGRSTRKKLGLKINICAILDCHTDQRIAGGCCYQQLN